MMSKRLIFIISSLFLVQLGVLGWWSYWEQIYLVEKDKQHFKNQFATAFMNPSIVDVLDLSGRNLKEIPNYFQDFKNIKHIDLSNNQLSEIPDWILTLKLESLNLSHNQLTEIPDFEHSVIENLNLSFNQISMPSAALDNSKIYMPKGLKVLNISDNKITIFPSTLDLLYQPLEEINISNNPIKIIDAFIFKSSLQKITALNTVGFNKILTTNSTKFIDINDGPGYIVSDWKTKTFYKPSPRFPYDLSSTNKISAGSKLPNLKVLVLDFLEKEHFCEQKDTMIINGLDTTIFKISTDVNARNKVIVSYSSYDDNFSSFENLETLRLTNIKESGRIAENKNLKILELKTKNRYLYFDFHAVNLQKLIVNENSLKAVLRGDSYCPFLEELVIEKENQSDINMQINLFKKRYPNVKITLMKAGR